MISSTCLPPSIPFFEKIFHECVYDWVDGLGVILGYASIICWINVQFPQLWENYKNKSVESLSYVFLAIWFFGDLFNLIGGTLTGQQPFQIYLAWYFVIMDLTTILQCLYYNLYYSTTQFNESDQLISVDDTSSRISNRSKWLKSTFLTLLLFLFFRTDFYSHTKLPDIDYDLVGLILSWFCTILYLGSRLPQIIKNYTRKSVAGLSIHMFGFAFIANFFYTASIFLRCYHDTDLLYNSLPFLIGSAGTMLSDALLFYQFQLYHLSPPIVIKDHPLHRSPITTYSTPLPTLRSHPVDVVVHLPHHPINSPQDSSFKLPLSFYATTPIPLRSQLENSHRRHTNQD